MHSIALESPCQPIGGQEQGSRGDQQGHRAVVAFHPKGFRCACGKENGILFVCFPVTAIAAVLSRSPMTVKRSLNELENAGLIMRVRQGVGEPNRIYVLIPGKEDAALA